MLEWNEHLEQLIQKPFPASDSIRCHARMQSHIPGRDQTKLVTRSQFAI